MTTRAEQDLIWRAEIHAQLRLRTVKSFMIEASEIYGVTLDVMASRNRTDRVARARQWVMYHAAAEGRSSQSAIGRALGGRDHATVNYGIKVHRSRHCLPVVLSLESPPAGNPVVYVGPEPTLANKYQCHLRRRRAS
jgi:hypothetical protein